MKTRILIALLISSPLFGQDAAKDAADAFASHFFDDANVSDYIAKVDALIDAGESHIYASPAAESAGKDSSQSHTSNGIFMIYTVTRTTEGVVVHFSVSRPPYLASVLGKNIVSLFMVRSGWPQPTVFNISQNQVFHAIWLVPSAEFDRVRESLPKIRAEIRKDTNPKTVFVKAVIAAGKLESQPIPQPAPSAKASAPPPAPGQQKAP